MNTSNDTALARPRTVWFILAALTLLGSVLRFYQLNTGLWYDEITTLIYSVRAPLAEIVTRFPGNNDHMLFSVLAHLSIEVFGEHAWSLRLPAVIFGIATIPMLYLFGKTVTTRFEALASCLLLSVSYHHIWFSQNARGYSALLFFALLTSYLLLIGIRRDSRKAYVAYAAIAALGIYTHLTMAFIILSHGLIVASHILVTSRGKIQIKALKNPAIGFVLAGLFSLLLYAPVTLEVRTFFLDGPKVESPATAIWALLEIVRGLQIGFGAMGGVVLVGSVLLIGCWSYLRQSPLVLGLFLLPAPITLAVAILLERPTFPRFFFFLMGFGLLIAVRGTVTIAQWIASRSENPWFPNFVSKLPAGLVIVMALLSLLALPYGYRFPKQDFEQAMHFVESEKSEGDSVVLIGKGATEPYRNYYGKPWERIDSVEQLQAARATSPAVWVLYTFRMFVAKGVPDLLAALETQCNEANLYRGTVAGGNVVVYKCPPQRRRQSDLNLA